jgi:aminopeptidase N
LRHRDASRATNADAVRAAEIVLNGLAHSWDV